MIKDNAKDILIKYKKAKSLYNDSCYVDNYFDESRQFNIKQTLNNYYSSSESFLQDDYKYSPNRNIIELYEGVNKLSNKTYEETEKGNRNFNTKHLNPIIETLKNGKSESGKTIQEVFSFMLARNPELTEQTIQSLVQLMECSDAMQQFDSIAMSAMLNGYVLDMTEEEMELWYKDKYSNDDNIKYGFYLDDEGNQQKYPDWEYLDKEQKEYSKLLLSQKLGAKDKYVSTEQVMKDRQKFINLMFQEAEAVPFFYGILQQMSNIQDEAESLFYNPESMTKECFLRAECQKLLFGDACIITQYNKENKCMEMYVPFHDSVYWLVNKSNKITDIFLRHKMTVHQAQEEFEPEEFSKIVNALSLTVDDLNSNLYKEIYLIQHILVSFDKMKPNYSCWITDNGEDETVKIRDSFFQDLPIHIIRHKPNQKNGRGQSYVMPIFRTLNELHNLRLSVSIATTRGLEQNIIVHEDLHKQIDINKPGQIIAGTEDLMREQNLVRPLTSELDSNIIQLADTRELKLIQEINNYFLIDQLDTQGSEIIKPNTFMSLSLAQQRMKMNLNMFIGSFEQLFTSVCSSFVRSVASSYDNQAVPNENRFSTWLDVRIVGLNEKATKEEQTQKALQTFGQFVQLAQAIAPVNPDAGINILDQFNIDRLVKDMLEDTPHIQQDPEIIAQMQQARAEQQQQQQMAQQQAEMAQVGAQVNKSNADADLSRARAVDIQLGN